LLYHMDELEPGTGTEVVKIGPWRARWWEEFPSGFSIRGRNLSDTEDHTTGVP
jgi:hypothetical protein